jgi:predicted outer membrane repeat protein
MKKILWEKIKVNGDIPQPRFGHTFTIISKNKAILFGGAISLSGLKTL